MVDSIKAAWRLLFSFVMPAILILTVFTPIVVKANADEVDSKIYKVAELSSQVGRLIADEQSEKAVTSMALGSVTSAVSNRAENWFNQFGTAQVKLNTAPDFSLNGSSLDFLFPLYNSATDIVFSQVGIRENDDLVTTNIGLGHRHFFHQWMFGYNAFLDSTWNNVNRRYGFGSEVWVDNLHISSNLYHGLTDWHSSRSHDGYDERPADGWDVRAEGWLPKLPQLGGKIVYEQYYGDGVSLFDDFNDRQHNPHSFTLGVNYTPVPLVTMGLDQKLGKNGVHDTQFILQMTYRPGVSWVRQISPNSVVALRQLSSNRLDLVNRNNDIVLDYRKQDNLVLHFPLQVTGEALSSVTLIPMIESSNGLDHIELNDGPLLHAGGKIISNSNNVIVIQLPNYQNLPIPLDGVAVDRKGNRSNVAETLITTSPLVLASQVTVDKTSVKADGNDHATYTVTVTDDNNQPIAGKTVSWSTNFGKLASTTGTTNSSGQTSVTLSSTSAGQAIVQAEFEGVKLLTNPVMFVAQFGSPSLTVPTEDTIGGPALNIDVALSEPFIITYQGMQAGDVVSLAAKIEGIDGQHAFTKDYTVTSADVAQNSVAMGPYPEDLLGIDTHVSTKNGHFRATVTRPATGQRLSSPTVDVFVDTK
ncbi:inverse autotransporter beta domain-containing protein [Aeromonas sp. HMWF016]|uniref:inverse autotransporter beta domain-containing protein n=1 Tax=Aeromonas sp. HMWF016 TaxID=2056852 RepID=UPI0011B1FE31|nr:inverse autotransporter beta domain-containing protein [Aeromonas sp. HMWF016]